jgi:hypothetical protein
MRAADDGHDALALRIHHDPMIREEPVPRLATVVVVRQVDRTLRIRSDEGKIVGMVSPDLVRADGQRPCCRNARTGGHELSAIEAE